MILYKNLPKSGEKKLKQFISQHKYGHGKCETLCIEKDTFIIYPNVDILLTDECVMSVTNHYIRKNNKLGTIFRVIHFTYFSIFPNLNEIITYLYAW